ncbi:MAG TPA: OsmC family protein [Bacteroidia bacterium]|nr:OsmC family protein [Bacteroidia bacterium]
MQTSDIIYIGQLRCKATHTKSGVEIITDAPPDNRGKGESFSPTDSVANALGTCALTTMGIVANDNNINMDNASAKITKVMAGGPRRISEVWMEISFPPNNYSAEQKKLLENTALNCPVAKSLHPDIKQKVTFNY